MSERDELRALAIELHDEWCLQGESGPEPDWRAAESCHGFAGSVMESDWLRAHDDRIRAETLAPALALADDAAHSCGQRILDHDGPALDGICEESAAFALAEWLAARIKAGAQ